MKNYNDYTVTEETFDSMTALWKNPESLLSWDCLFALPVWLQTWWSIFGAESTPYICSVKHGETVIGLAPLMIFKDTAMLIGDVNVCDYLDFVLVPGREKEFFKILTTHLRQQGITTLDLRGQHPHALMFKYLKRSSELIEKFKFKYYPDGVSFGFDLPGTWNDYLYILSRKQRHEVRRKFRRLKDAGPIHLRLVEEVAEVASFFDLFLDLFRSNQPEKIVFLTDQMTAFFKSLAAATAEIGILKLYFLDVGDAPAAAAFCFDYQSTLYLYNNGYDQYFSPLNVGFLNKVLTIKDSIQRGLRKYDFLKGDEAYKQRLGGKPVPLYNGQVSF